MRVCRRQGILLRIQHRGTREVVDAVHHPAQAGQQADTLRGVGEGGAVRKLFQFLKEVHLPCRHALPGGKEVGFVSGRETQGTGKNGLPEKDKIPPGKFFKTEIQRQTPVHGDTRHLAQHSPGTRRPVCGIQEQGRDRAILRPFQEHHMRIVLPHAEGRIARGVDVHQPHKHAGHIQAVRDTENHPTEQETDAHPQVFYKRCHRTSEVHQANQICSGGVRNL